MFYELVVTINPNNNSRQKHYVSLSVLYRDWKGKLTVAGDSISREPSIARAGVASNSIGTAGVVVTRVVTILTLIDIWKKNTVFRD